MRRLFCFLVLLECQILASDVTSVRSSSSKALTSARMAEQELSKNSPQSISSAIFSLEQICNDTSFRRLQIDERYEIFRALLLAYQKGKVFEKQEALTFQLLNDNAFRPYWVSLKVNLAHLYLAQDRTFKAAEIVHALKSLPERRLTYHDREEIAHANTSLNKACEQKLAKAESHYEKGEYTHAASLYKSLHELSLKRYFPQTLSQQSQRQFLEELTFRLCLSYLLQNDYKSAHLVLQMQPLKATHALYLQGLIAKREGRMDEAISYFLKCQPPTKASLLDGAYCAITLGRYTLARELVEPIKNEPQTACILCLLEIEEENFAKAEELLEQHEEESFYHFIKGYLFFQKALPDFACVHLEQAAQMDNRWRQEAVLCLGQTYLLLSQKSYPEAEREVFFERAIHCFEELKQQKGESHLIGTRAEAESYVCHGSARKLWELIESIEPNDPCRYELLLAFAKLTKQFDEVTKSQYSQEPHYPKALLLASSFDKAYDVIVQRGHLEQDFFMIREIVEELTKQKSGEKARGILQDLVSKIHAPALIEECHYLMLWTEKSGSLQSYDQFLMCYPNSAFTQDVLFLKGLSLWNSEQYQPALELFEKAAWQHPHPDELLFYIANCKEKLGRDAKADFMQLYTEYPKSAFAAESYFRYFPESAYMRQDIEAIAHLKKMPSTMHETLYGVLSGFYIASAMRQEIPQKSLTDAQRRLLQETIVRFDVAINHANFLLPTLSPAMKDPFVRHLFAAKLERLQALFSLGSYGQVIQASDELKKECTHADLWQEASFFKARALLLEGHEAFSREELSNLLEYSKANNCESGEALIKAMVELALYKNREELFSEAELLLSKAMIAHGKGAANDLMLEILIAKSLVHQKKGEQDMAMMLLSSVINDESASSLRIQAMYLRAELYEQKGRRDLAFRQLQAAAKKGGEWGERCRQKLGDKYGYE